MSQFKDLYTTLYLTIILKLTMIFKISHEGILGNHSIAKKQHRSGT